MVNDFKVSRLLKLHEYWSFWIAIISVITWSTKYTSVLLHNSIGLVILFLLALFATILQNTVNKSLTNVYRNIKVNRLFLFFFLVYSINVIIRVPFGKAFDFQSIFSVLEILIAIVVVFWFLYDNKCFRIFQILFILSVGIQSVFTCRELINNFNIARIVVDENINPGGVWIFGDQGNFATNAILIPILSYRAFTEKGILRVVLIFLCGAIAFAAAISQFGTALGLLLLGMPIFTIICFFFVKNQKWKSISFLLLAFLLVGGYFFIGNADNPYLVNSFDKIIKVSQDAKSGGYGEKYESESRWFLADKSFRSFVSSPILGKGLGSIRYSDSVGGHSAFFDMLGFYGLFGAGAFISMLFLFLRAIWKRLQTFKNLESASTMASMILLILVGVVNPYWEGQPTALVILLARPFRFYDLKN